MGESENTISQAEDIIDVEPGDASNKPRVAKPTNGEAKSSDTIEDLELTDADLKKIAKLKIYGKEEKIPLKDVLTAAQKAKAAIKYQQQHAEELNTARTLAKLAHENPKEFLRHYGHDLDKLAEQVIAEQLKVAQMDEPAKRQYDLEKQLEQEKAEKERLSKEKEASEADYLAQQAQKFIDDEHTAALKELNLPPNRYLIKRAAHAQYVALQNGEALTAKDAYNKIISEFVDDFRHYAKAVGKDSASIRKLLGDDMVKIILDSEVKRVTEKTAPNINSTERSGLDNPVPSKKKSYLSEREWRDWQQSLRKQA